MISKLTDLCITRSGKWITLAIWLVLAGVIIGLSPSLDTSANMADFLPDEAESTKAYELSAGRFASQGIPVIVVFRNEDGLSDDDYVTETNFYHWLSNSEISKNIISVLSISKIPEARQELISPDNTTMTVLVNFSGSPTSDLFKDSVKDIRDQVRQIETESLQIKVGGPGGLLQDLIKVFENIDGLLLIVTAVLVLVLLSAIYRAPVVALTPLIVVGLVLQVSQGLLANISSFSDFLRVNGQATGIMTVVLFGSGTDYCLFVSSRFREELRQVDDVHEAMKRTMDGIGIAVACAGGTIIIATGLLLLSALRSYQTLGPVIGLGVLVMTVAALTLVPAVLTIFGRFSFWPFRPKFSVNQPMTNSSGGIYSKIGKFVMNKPIGTLIVCVVVLGSFITGIFTLERSFDSLDSLPRNTESVQSFEMLRSGFSPGQISPTQVYVSLGNGKKVRQSLDIVDRISLRFYEHEAVSGVISPSRPYGMMSPIDKKQVEETLSKIEKSDPGYGLDFLSRYKRYVSIDEEIALVELILKDNPYGSEAMDSIPELRTLADRLESEFRLGEGQILIGGETSEQYDTRLVGDRDTNLVLPLILLAIFIVLMLLLKSLVAPIYLVATIAFTYFSTLGLSMLIFKFGFNHEVITPSLPFFLFVFLNALGVDYNIYLMSRVREEAKKSNLDDAVEKALSNTGGVITSAGLILAGTFSALISLPLLDLMQLGIAVAVGVLMDTFITRTLIVPAIIKLLGRWNWWPNDIRVSTS
ncbi:MAG: hypothetical protein CL760_07565 [Chloroflexi bacterium]|nr:hypothetical protein [Chloroflexota bacterium]MQG05802.1 hypothetical protein [SAR202 cluster bacterium]